MTYYQSNQVILVFKGPFSLVHGLPLLLICSLAANAETVNISVPGGTVPVELSHVGPKGSLVSPDAPGVTPFRPPSIFSAPLPSGSGARALGVGGAFTAVADDATAASWNPAGLIQLEQPEASFMYRYSSREAQHASDDSNYLVGDDEYDSYNLNYLSAAVPFQVLDRYCVFSLNYQEVYNFEQRFHADQTDMTTTSDEGIRQSSYSGTQVDHFDDGVLDVTITSELSTRLSSQFQQVLNSETLTDISFEQEGIIDALSPAFATEIKPGLAIGVALNIYQDDLLGYRPIRSVTRASYAGSSTSRTRTTDTRTTTGTYTYDGIWSPPLPGNPQLPISGSGTYPEFTDVSKYSGSSGVSYDGEYIEKNEFESLDGINATFGGLWSVSRFLSLGFSVDLPWTAEAKQEKTITSRETAYRHGTSQVLGETSYSVTESKDVEFRFPLYWAAGMVWKWNNVLSTSLDISQTQWSEFYYQADGEEKLNPLDGEPLGDSRLDDCWAARCGLEYILVFQNTEVPLRTGVSWEQRPATGSPDEFYGVSLGSGVSLGREPGRLILDVAYMYSWGNNVLKTLVPDQENLRTDMREHQVYLSCIYHF